MKFIVDVEEFWLEEEDLSSALKQAVITTVVNKIRDTIEAKVNETIDKVLKRELSIKIEGIVETRMNQFLATGMVKGNYSSDSPKSVEDWMATQFAAANKTILEYIDKEAKRQVAALQARYDVLFASQIVQKLHGQGMLKEDIAKILLTDGKS